MNPTLSPFEMLSIYIISQTHWKARTQVCATTHGSKAKMATRQSCRVKIMLKKLKVQSVREGDNKYESESCGGFEECSESVSHSSRGVVK